MKKDKKLYKIKQEARVEARGDIEEFLRACPPKKGMKLSEYYSLFKRNYNTSISSVSFGRYIPQDKYPRKTVFIKDDAAKRFV